MTRQLFAQCLIAGQTGTRNIPVETDDAKAVIDATPGVLTITFREADANTPETGPLIAQAHEAQAKIFVADQVFDAGSVGSIEDENRRGAAQSMLDMSFVRAVAYVPEINDLLWVPSDTCVVNRQGEVLLAAETQPGALAPS